MVRYSPRSFFLYHLYNNYHSTLREPGLYNIKIMVEESEFNGAALKLNSRAVLAKLKWQKLKIQTKGNFIHVNNVSIEDLNVY